MIYLDISSTECSRSIHLIVFKDVPHWSAFLITENPPIETFVGQFSQTLEESGTHAANGVDDAGYEADAESVSGVFQAILRFQDPCIHANLVPHTFPKGKHDLTIG